MARNHPNPPADGPERGGVDVVPPFKLDPPEDLTNEALLEWHRVTADLSECGKLAGTDRALLVIYVGTWQIHQDAMRVVLGKGATKKHTNGIVGRRVEYGISRETAKQLVDMLRDLGLTPLNRGKVQPVKRSTGLDF